MRQLRHMLPSSRHSRSRRPRSSDDCWGRSRRCLRSTRSGHRRPRLPRATAAELARSWLFGCRFLQEPTCTVVEVAIVGLADTAQSDLIGRHPLRRARVQATQGRTTGLLIGRTTMSTTRRPRTPQEIALIPDAAPIPRRQTSAAARRVRLCLSSHSRDTASPRWLSRSRTYELTSRCSPPYIEALSGPAAVPCSRSR